MGDGRRLLSMVQPGPQGLSVLADASIGEPRAGTALLRLGNRYPFDGDDILHLEEVWITGDDGAAQTLG